MADEIVHRVREVHTGEGAQKQKPREPEKPREYKTAEQEAIDGIIDNEFVGPPSQNYVVPTEKVVAPTEDVIETPAENVARVEAASLIEPTQTVFESVRERVTKSLEDYIAGFRVLEKVGSGGVCDVFYVEQESTGNRFALKKLSEKRIAFAQLTNPEAGIRLRRALQEEAGLIGKMSQLNPCRFPAFAVDLTYQNEEGILTEYILHSVENLVGKLEPHEAVEGFLGAAEAIQTLHENGIAALGDIKPSNFRADENGILKLVDLNIKYIGDSVSNVSLMQSVGLSMVDAGSGVRGTPRYMAPEQWEGKADARTDVFQLAAFLYEMASGTRPEGRYEDLEGKLAVLNDVVHKGLSRDPTKRHQSVAELVAAVKEKFYPKVEEVAAAERTAVQSQIVLEQVETLEEKAASVDVSMGEVLAKTGFDVVRGIGKAIDFGNHFFVKGIAKTTLATSSTVYDFLDDDYITRLDKKGDFLGASRLIGSAVGVIGGVIGCIGGYWAGFSRDPETTGIVLGAHAAIQAASGLHTLYKHNKRKLQAGGLEAAADGATERVDSASALEMIKDRSVSADNARVKSDAIVKVRNISRGDPESKEKYIILPGRKHGDHEYPDMLVAMDRAHFGRNWEECWDAVKREGAVMLNLRQYADFLGLLKSGKAFDGNGNSLQSARVYQLLDDIVQSRDPYRAEWIDAKFSNKTVGRILGVIPRNELHITYHSFDSSGVLKEITEPVRECLMNDKTPGIKLDSWLADANYQGLPLDNVENGKLNYWAPTKGKVARFWVSLGCRGDPSYRDSWRGVRPSYLKI